MTQEQPREPKRGLHYDPATQQWVEESLTPAAEVPPGTGEPPPGAGAVPPGGRGYRPGAPPFGAPPFGSYRQAPGGGYTGAWSHRPFGAGAAPGAPPGAGFTPKPPPGAGYGPRAEDVQYQNLIAATAAALRGNKTRIASLMYDLTKEVVWRVGYGARIKRLIVKGATAVYRGFKRHILRMRG